MLPGVLTSDSELIGELLAQRVRRRSRAPTAATSSTRSRRCCPQLAGAFSLVLMDEAHLFGVRDRARLPPARARQAPKAAG